MSKQERNIRRTIFFAVIAVVVLLLCGAFRGTKADLTAVPYCVQAGDTLWSIATEYKPTEMDTREYIHMIQEHNNINAKIQAGQAIEVLVWER